MYFTISERKKNVSILVFSSDKIYLQNLWHKRRNKKNRLALSIDE